MDIKKEIKEFRDKWYSHDKEILARKRQYGSLEELEVELESSQFAIDLEGYHYECLFKEQAGEYLYVIYNGARYTDLPEFPRWGYHNLFDGSMLCLEDPMYYKYPDMICGSFYGDRGKSGIVISLVIIKAVCRKLGISEDKVIFFSSSQGGYSGTYASTLMPNTLSIALNPRLFIQDTPHTKNFTDVCGIDLNAPDQFHRNDIIHCIKNSSSVHVMLFNIQCEHDWTHHGQRFCHEFGIEPCYGFVAKDNCLFWVYDCAGAPNPHTSFETKGIFMFIDRVAKAFYAGLVTEEMQKTALTVNECWHDIFGLKSNLYLKNKQKRPDFMYTQGGQVYSGEKISELANITISKRNHRYNHFRYNVHEKNMKITIRISGIEGSVDRLSAGIYDFKNEDILHYEEYSTLEDIIFSFITGDDIEGLGFCVYAGIAGSTQGQQIRMRHFEVWGEKL